MEQWENWWREPLLGLKLLGMQLQEVKLDSERVAR
jgi:hypothetical protein